MTTYRLVGTENPRTGEESVWVARDGKSMCPEDILDDLVDMQAEIERLKKQLLVAEAALKSQFRMNVDSPLFDGLVGGVFADGALLASLAHCKGERDEARNEIERLRALLEPCRPDTDAQTDPAYPQTVNDVLSLLSAYIADFLPAECCPGDEYFAAWERQARKVVEPLVQQLVEAYLEVERLRARLVA